MTTVAVIAEFNPPHNGHSRLVRQIRERFGADTCVIGIMSGNYVQRGDVAILNKYERAHAALAVGFNLILELPFPYSLASAEDFARAGVRIAQSLGVVDHLCFGSESQDVTILTQIADYTDSDHFLECITRLRSDKRLARCSFAELATRAVADQLGITAAEQMKLPNNILSISYMSAIRKSGAAFDAVSFPRENTEHKSTPTASDTASACAIRTMLFNHTSADLSPYVPKAAADIIHRACRNGTCPALLDHLSAPLLLFFQSNTFTKRTQVTAESDRSLLARIQDKAGDASDFTELTRLVKARHYTDAHIRRALLFAYFGITSADLQMAPPVTHLLAADKIGLSQFRIIRHTGTIPIVTKPADYRQIPDETIRQFIEKGIFADRVYCQTLPKPQSGSTVFRFSPFIEK